jgi:membrane-associated phospholipid phosphatase
MTRRLDVPALDGQADLGNLYGNGALLGGAALGLMVGGRVAGNEALRTTGGEMARALILSGAMVWGLKLAVHRRRPNGGAYSFPSGHSAAAFSVAPVLARRFGWRAGVPAFALAAFTGMGRMEDRRHYLSDVIFGAAVGVAVGEAVSGGERTPGLLSHLSLGPRGAAFTTSF